MRNVLTGFDLANEVRMARRGGENRTILIVEGRSDHKFYIPYVDKSRCEIYGREGKPAIIQCIDILNSDSKMSGYLGIVDADYDLVHKVDLRRDNLIIIYCGDLERMVLSPKTIQKLLAELGEQCLIEESPQEIYDIILKEAAKIGWFRYLASLAELKFKPNKYRVSFRNISIISSMFDKDGINIDQSIIETDIMRSSRDRFSFVDLATILGVGERQTNNLTDLSISQGHDIFEIFSIGIERKWGRRSMRSDVLEYHTRLAYEREDFLLTTVYNDINTWELANKPYKIFLAS